MLLTLPRQGTTPQILKLNFPVQTSVPKHKRRYNKLKVIKILNATEKIARQRMQDF
jgi:hypothetical protein